MSDSGRSGGTREVAHRLFAAEYEDADFSYSESDEDRAPNYVVTPTGARVNRLFVVGVLTEVEQVGDNVLRARVVDPTGAFVLYAGQYQPDEQAFLERANPPRFVAVTGKARTFQPEDSDRIYTSVRPESINEVNADTRDRWTVQAAEQTVERVETTAAAIASEYTGDRLQAALSEAGVTEGLAHGIPLALDHYGTTPTYLAGVRDLAVDAARVVAGDIDEVSGLDVDPDATGDVTPGDIAEELLDLPDRPATEPAESVESAGPDETEGAVESTGPGETEGAAEGATADEGVATDDEDQTESVGSTVTETTTMDTSLDAGDESGDEAGEEAGATGDTDAGSAPEISEVRTTSGGGEAGEEGESAEAGVREEAVEAGEDDQPAEADDVGDFSGDEFDLEEETREEIEEEYGTEFQSGTEVDEPGAADIEGPDGGEAAPGEEATDVQSGVETEPSPDAEATDSDVETSASDVDTSESDLDTSESDIGTTPSEVSRASTDVAGDSGLDSGTDDTGTDDAGTDETGTSSVDTSTTSLSSMDSGGGTADSGAGDETGGPDTDRETATTESTIGTTETTAEGSAGEPDGDAGESESGGVGDVQGAVLKVMAELDDGDGASREEVVGTMLDRHGLDAEEVEDAIQDALMAGECYEPGEDVLKPI